MTSVLAPYRVLDCTDHHGQLAGLILAQLGAEVVLVEPPGGSSGRRRSPYAGDRPDPEGALFHWAYNRGKRSVVLDVQSADGRTALADLAAGVDILLWSGRPAEIPFDYDALTQRNPGLVAVALTSFGLSGPKADWLASDLIVSAASCQLAVTGNADRPPLQMGSPQGYLHGAVDAAMAAILGLVERGRSGRGQLADVSAQASCLQATFCYSLNQAWGAPPVQRAGDGVNMGGYTLRWVYPAADGEVSITLLFGSAMAEFTGNLFQWIWEEGECDEATRDKPWADLWVRLASGDEPAAELDRICDVIARFTASRKKADLQAEAARRRVLMAPVASLPEVLDSGHLAARGFWDEVTPAGGDRAHRCAGRFVVSTVAPLRTLGPAPRLGEASVEEFADSRPAPTAPSVTASPVTPPLAGLKVLDLAWSIAGPLIGRTLADFGATVVKVENHNRPDLARSASPFHRLNDQHPLEGSGLFADTNAGKLGIELDLASEAGREVFWDLVRWCDVVIESFSAGTLPRMGLGYDRMRGKNPSVILLSSSLAGETGTLDLPGYGNLTTALFGFTTTTRWPGERAAGPFGAYTDAVSPRFGITALLAALDHRRRTGEGQHLDLSQAESSLHFLSPALLDAEVNRRDFDSLGNGHPDLAPHGVYAAAGDDRWIAIVAPDDAAWGRLSELLGHPDLANLPASDRLARRSELDDLVSAWTAGRDPEVMQSELQSLGICGHQVQNTAECLSDPQLTHRGHYVTVEHHLLGPITLQGPRFGLSRTPGQTAAAGPTYGQHAQQVLTEFLGYDEERITELVIAGALGG